MYSEWISLTSAIATNSQNAQSQSVLNKFPASAGSLTHLWNGEILQVKCLLFVGREVTISVVKQLASNLGITQNAEPSHFIKDEEVSEFSILYCLENRFFYVYFFEIVDSLNL